MIECASNGTAQSYSYDALGRMTLQTETVSGQEFTKSYSYDSYGRLQTENWNTGFGIMYQYNQNGYLSHVKTQNNHLIWQGQAYNARGQVTDYLLGDDYRTTKSWDNYGFQEQISIPANPSFILNGKTGVLAFADWLMVQKNLSVFYHLLLSKCEVVLLQE